MTFGLLLDTFGLSRSLPHTEPRLRLDGLLACGSERLPKLMRLGDHLVEGVGVDAPISICI